MHTHGNDTAFCRGNYFPRSRRRPTWVDQSIPVVFRSHSPGIDPFDDVQLGDEDSGLKIERQELFDHTLTSARLVFTAQHRISLFMLLIIGRRFRLLRWDRAGVIVTPSIDYYNQPAVLCDIFRRLSHLDDVGLGFDPSATRVSPGKADYLRMEAAATRRNSDIDHHVHELPEFEPHGKPVFAYVRSLFRTSLAEEWPRYKLAVPHATGTREYLVGKPVFISDTLFGRGTRGYVALDCTTDRFVWLKDTWRSSYLFADREGDILQRLNHAGIDNVPTLASHGDIPLQVTTSSNWTGQPLDASAPIGSIATPDKRKRKREDEDDEVDGAHGSDGPLPRHTHYRLVVEEVCIPLRWFENSRQLVSITADCLRGELHETAWRSPLKYVFKPICRPQQIPQRDCFTVILAVETCSCFPSLQEGVKGCVHPSLTLAS